MVECGANEVPEAEILDALDIAHSRDQEAVRRAGRAAARRPASPSRRSRSRRPPTAWSSEIAQSHGDDARRGHLGPGQARAPGRDEGRRGGGARAVLRARRTPTDYAENRQNAQLAFDTLEKKIIRQRIAVHKKRPDGRSEREIRQITIDVKPLPRTHGSALFTRGQTQALSRRRARHHARGDAPGQPRARDVQALLPPLQLPALLGGRGRLHARPQAPRHRPRRARRARAGPDDPGPGEVPVHDPRRVGHPGVQRLVARWPRSAAPRCR